MVLETAKCTLLISRLPFGGDKFVVWFFFFLKKKKTVHSKSCKCNREAVKENGIFRNIVKIIFTSYSRQGWKKTSCACCGNVHRILCTWKI